MWLVESYFLFNQSRLKVFVVKELVIFYIPEGFNEVPIMLIACEFEESNKSRGSLIDRT